MAILPPTIFNLSFPLNGLAPAGGFLWSGQPENVGTTAGNTLRAITEGAHVTPHVIFTVPPGSNSFSASCCNEQMVVAPDGSFYHAHYADVIQRLAIAPSGTNSGSTVVATFAQTNVVGMASDGTKIWISKFNGEVGTWDPATNVYTFVFSTPTGAGALAWDIANGVLWVGMEGGNVTPYNATGQVLGATFQPFGVISNTVDGMAFVPD